MNIAYDKLIVELETKLKKLDRIDKFNKKLDAVNLKMNKMGRITDAATGKFVGMEDAMERLRKKQNAATKSMGGMNMQLMSFGFAALFGGMAIKALGQSIIKGLGNAFMLLADEQNAGVKRTLELQAAVKFLKFILFDTFANTDMYANFVNFIVNSANRMGELVQQHPNIVKLMAVFLMFTVVLGSVAMVLGQMALISMGLGTSMWGVAGIVGVLAGMLTVMFFIWSSGMSNTWKWTLSIATATVAFISIVKLLGLKWAWVGKMMAWVAANPVVLLALAIVGVSLALINMTNRVGGLWNMVKVVVAGAGKAFIWLGSSVIQSLIDKIQFLIGLAHKLAVALGFSGMASKLHKISQSMINFEKIKDGAMIGAMNKIETSLGIDKIRSEQNLPDDPMALMKAMAFGAVPEELGGTGDTQLANLKKSNENLEISNMSLKEIEKFQAQGNDILESMKTDGININDDGITRLSKAMGVEVSRETIQALFNQGTIVPSTEN